MCSNEIKILHCSDIHLCSKINYLNKLKSNQRNNEIKNNFIKTLKFASNKNVDIFLIAGDLFDKNYIDNNTIQEIKYSMEKYKFKIVISPGNHDPFTSDSPYNSKWPNNVHIFNQNCIKHFYFSDIDVKVFGNAFTNTYLDGKNIVFKKVSEPNNDKTINIGLFHSDILIKSDNNLYFPMDINKISTLGFDYIALGHIHKRSKIQKLNQTYFSYCGCFEGRGFDEIGEKGVYIGKVCKKFADLKFYKTCIRQYINYTVDISNCLNAQEVCEKIRSDLNDKYGENFTENLYKITLVGEISNEYLLDVTDINSKLDDLFYVKIIDKTEPFIDTKNIYLGKDLKSIFLRRMISILKNSESDEDKTIAKQALKIGLRAFKEEVKYIDN